MSTVDSLAILEGQRLFIGGNLVGEGNDISGSGLLNSDTYRSRIDDVYNSDPLPEHAWFMVRSLVMYRPKISRILQIIGALVKKDSSNENKRLLSTITVWIQKHMSDHSNVSSSIIPIHAMNQAGAPTNFGIFTRLTANLSNAQFLLALLSQRWSCQLRIASDAFMVTHKELARRWWDRKIRKTTRDPSSYSQSSDGFQVGFVEEYYSTTSSDSYLIVVDDVAFDGYLLGDSNFNGYVMSDLIKIREEILFRIPYATRLFESENLTSVQEVFENAVELGGEQFRNELDALFPNEMIGRIFAKKAMGALSDEDKETLKGVGLLSINKGKRYLDERIKIGELVDLPFSTCERTHVYPTFSNESLSRALDAKSRVKPSDPTAKGDERKDGEPPEKKPKTGEEAGESSKVSFSLSEKMEERIKIAAGKVTATAKALKELSEKGIDANIARVLDQEFIEILGCAVVGSEEYKDALTTGSDLDKSLKIAGFIDSLDYNEAIELLKSL